MKRIDRAERNLKRLKKKLDKSVRQRNKVVENARAGHAQGYHGHTDVAPLEA